MTSLHSSGFYRIFLNIKKDFVLSLYNIILIRNEGWLLLDVFPAPMLTTHTSFILCFWNMTTYEWGFLILILYNLTIIDPICLDFHYLTF
jgi:hypothetical protein